MMGPQEEKDVQANDYDYKIIDMKPEMFNLQSDDNGSQYNGVVYDSGHDTISTNAKVNDFDAVTIRAFLH